VPIRHIDVQNGRKRTGSLDLKVEAALGRHGGTMPSVHSSGCRPRLSGPRSPHLQHLLERGLRHRPGQPFCSTQPRPIRNADCASVSTTSATLVQLAAERDYGGGQGAVPATPRHVGDEGAVYLQFVHRQPLQVAQRRLADTEIVQRHAEARFRNSS